MTVAFCGGLVYVQQGGRLQVLVAKVQIQNKPCFWWWEAARHPQSPNHPSMAKSI